MTNRLRSLWEIEREIWLEIWQIGDCEFVFYAKAHPDIIEWINNDCAWNYRIFTSVGFDNHPQYRTTVFRQTCLVFLDIKGVIEFKLRFV